MTKRLITLTILLLLSAAGAYGQNAQAVMDVKVTVLKAAEVEADLLDKITVVQNGELDMGTIRVPSPDSDYQVNIPGVVMLRSPEGQTLELSLRSSMRESGSGKMIILNGKIAKSHLQKKGSYRAEVNTTIVYM